MNKKIVVHISFFQAKKYFQNHNKIINLRKIIENYLKISKKFRYLYSFKQSHYVKKQ